MITLSFLLFHVNRISLCILQYAAAVAAADMLVMLMMLRLCSEDADALLSCAFLWKSVFDMMSHLLQSAGQDMYIALSSPLVNHWKLISGTTYLFIYLFL